MPLRSLHAPQRQGEYRRQPRGQHLFWDEQDVYNRLESVMKTAFTKAFKIQTDHKVNMRLAAIMLGWDG